ncbi:MAG: murein L,D-transpeptidase catalytic domain family protein [Bacteroidales bacterium]|nr:murein L,D-transpeptidase catalytic domain family protein [Bacteroidales bacterium]
MVQLFFPLLSAIVFYLFLNGIPLSAGNTEPVADFTGDYTDGPDISLLEESKLSPEAFRIAYEGFKRLEKEKQLKNDSLITIIDFSKPSYEERLFIFDLKNTKLVYKSLVAHGKNSGEVYAGAFSNNPQSYQSSLGLYLTLGTYNGRHGYSLRLKGLDKGINDKAMKRAIVIHGAEYASQSYISRHGRLGRSFGCPALPYDMSEIIIDLIKNGSCLYIYHPNISWAYPSDGETKN